MVGATIVFVARDDVGLARWWVPLAIVVVITVLLYVVGFVFGKQQAKATHKKYWET